MEATRRHHPIGLCLLIALAACGGADSYCFEQICLGMSRSEVVAQYPGADFRQNPFGGLSTSIQVSADWNRASVHLDSRGQVVEVNAGSRDLNASSWTRLHGALLEEFGAPGAEVLQTSPSGATNTILTWGNVSVSDLDPRFENIPITPVTERSGKTVVVSTTRDKNGEPVFLYVAVVRAD